MTVDVAFPIFASALFGLMVWVAALLLGWTRAPHVEHLAWWRLMFPLFAGALVLAFLAGWAFQESNPVDERVCLVLRSLSCLVACVGMRAAVRAAKALSARGHANVPICTVGLFRPRVVVSDEFRRTASEHAVTAALAHEAAHVRWRDPLRIWLAQVGTDLQWPIPGSAQRFSAWLLALEAQRDSEAVTTGVGAEDLAEAILAAARLQCCAAAGSSANAAGAGGEGIKWRIRRLLSRDDSEGVPERWPLLWPVRASCVGLMSMAIWLGVNYGDVVLDAVPGIGP